MSLSPDQQIALLSIALYVGFLLLAVGAAYVA